MLDVIKHWIQNLTRYYQNDQQVIKALMAIPMDRKLTDEMLGRLIRMAVLQNAKCEMNSPMNVTQVHRMIEGGKELMSKEDFSNYSAWDFTNNLTEVIKPKTSDLMAMLNTNHAVNKFVTDAFNIQSTYTQN